MDGKFCFTFEEIADLLENELPIERWAQNQWEVRQVLQGLKRDLPEVLAAEKDDVRLLGDFDNLQWPATFLGSPSQIASAHTEVDGVRDREIAVLVCVGLGKSSLDVDEYGLIVTITASTSAAA